MEHTPLPWAIGTGSLGCGTHDHHGYVICPEGEAPCVAFGIETLDDALFIVRAVNNHMELLKALEVLIIASEVVKLSRSIETMTALGDAGLEARTAIKAARKS